MDVVPRHPELLEICPHGLGRESRRPAATATVAPGARFASLRPSGPRIRPWWTNSGGVAPSASNSRRCSAFIGAVVVAANDVRDAEVDVVDDRWRAGRSGSRPPAEQRETLSKRSPSGAPTSRWRSARSLCRTGPSSQAIPSHSRSRRIASSPPATLRAGSVSSIRSSIQSPQPPVRDRAQRVAEVERARRARRKTDSDRHASSVSSAPRWSPGAQQFSAKTASPPLPTQAS